MRIRDGQAYKVKSMGERDACNNLVAKSEDKRPVNSCIILKRIINNET